MRNQVVIFCTVVLIFFSQSCNPLSSEAVSRESISPVPTGLSQPESSPPSEPATVTPLPAPKITEEKMPFEITSIAFTHQGIIPPLYSCKGSDISPPLTWGEPPEGTRSFALVMDDPDGGNWIHWVIYNLPAEIRGLPENKPQNARLHDDSLQGTNTWGRLGYGGPCPPSGTHRYFFRLHALDSMLDLPSGARVPALVQAMAGHILAQVELMGFFSH
jgi:Raf kinase inhibitor-like YbhB/YbcL family protein